MSQPETDTMRRPVLFALHSGQLYGTERMSLATAEGLVDEFDPTIFAPPGPALEAAEPMGFETSGFLSKGEFFKKLRPLLAGHRSVAFVATGIVHSLACIAWNALYRRKVAHIHVIHGGTDEKDSYGRKKILNRFGVVFVAVSHYVKERLLAHGVREDRIVVIENFLTPDRISEAPRRGAFATDGIKRIAVVSRVDPIKRLDVLLDALERSPDLADLEIRIFGTGWQLEEYRARAAERLPNVRFEGFVSDVAPALADSDLLVHLCPEEPFGLAVLEAMAAGIPVLVPDSGGAGSLIEPGKSGFHFRANDASDLAKQLRQLKKTPAIDLQTIVEGGDMALSTRFSAKARIQDYRRLLQGEAP